ncbi:hypothetical protein L2E82_23195 [Cichorium intybus]|uniref:Uncharacterized protein n=1 Tax=Cichorium intybus TaxID=13427 RepID=A0ACB9DZI5_CICIN|nr:hypothetical protein L2E82_23195 [Cichorium intybus]
MRSSTDLLSRRQTLQQPIDSLWRYPVSSFESVNFEIKHANTNSPTIENALSISYSHHSDPIICFFSSSMQCLNFPSEILEHQTQRASKSRPSRVVITIMLVSFVTAELRNGYNQGTVVLLILDYQMEPFAANALGCGVGAAMIGNSNDPATSLKFCTTSLTAATIAFCMLN